VRGGSHEERKGAVLVDVIAFHHDPDRLPDDLASSESLVEVRCPLILVTPRPKS
jgi:hypothetical protein